LRLVGTAEGWTGGSAPPLAPVVAFGTGSAGLRAPPAHPSRARRSSSCRLWCGGTQIAPPASCCAGGAMVVAPVWIGACAYVAPRIPLLPRCSLPKSLVIPPITLALAAGRASPHDARAHCFRLARGKEPAARGWGSASVSRYVITAVPFAFPGPAGVDR
jgi:hypothetical protein